MVMEVVRPASISTEELWGNVREHVTLIFTLHHEGQGVLKAHVAPMAVHGKDQTKCGTEVPLSD